MEKILRVALAQINPVLGDFRVNTEKINGFIARARRLKADIVTFPELAICGYPPEDLLLKEHFVRDNLRALKPIIKRSGKIIAVIGFVDRDKQGHIYNAAAIIQNGKLKGSYHKIVLPNYGVFDEKRYFQAGSRPYIFILGKVRFAVNICEDIWPAEGVAEIQAKSGAGLILNISASPYYAGKIALRKKILAARARETKSFIGYNNLVGGQDELVFDGGSMLLNPQGEPVVCGRQFSEELIIAEVPLRVTTRSKGKNCIKLSRLTDEQKVDLVNKKKYRELDKTAEIYSALVLGTRDYISKNGFKKAVIGLSGGIDSALTTVIATCAIGRENVIGVSMPSRYSSTQTQSDAQALAFNLGIKFITVSINGLFEAYLKALNPNFKGLRADVTEENIQARIRGNILMALANKFGWLVLTTGNKSETSVGYCTLYGDTAGGFAVIKDVPKTLVYSLARFSNAQADKELIPQGILRRPPSAELKFRQKDQDTLPAYSVLDEILKDYIEEDKSCEQIIAQRGRPQVVKAVINMVDKNEYKRRQSPPGIKITPKAFGKDRRMPITNRYRQFK